MRKVFAIIFVLASLAGCKALPELAKDQLGVSALVVNLRDIYNVPQGPTGTPWQTRYRRIADWIGANNNVPDIIALQEAPGQWCGDMLADYAGLNFLINEIKSRSGQDYRIAYLLSHKQQQGEGDAWIGSRPAQFCQARGGRALLYRPDKLRNVERNVGFEFNDERHTAPHLLNSLPCCKPAADTAVCSLIDGPMHTAPGCNQPTPSGAAWTKRQSASDNPLDAVFSRLELMKQPGNYLHLYNVHLSWKKTGPLRTDETSAFGAASINALVDAMERRYARTPSDRLYPPILLGDFNLDTAAVGGGFPRFRQAIWSPEVMGVLFGDETVFPSKQLAYANGGQIVPSFGCILSSNGVDLEPAPLTLWSDHCASIYFRIEPTR